MSRIRRLKRFIISLIALTFISAAALAAAGAVSPASAATAPRGSAGLPAHTDGASGNPAYEAGSPVLYDPLTRHLEIYAVGANHALFEKYWGGTWSGWTSLGGSILTA